VSDRPLRIMHVIASLAPRYGGPAKVAELCSALAARGHRVEIVSTNIDGPDDLDVPLGVPLPRDGCVSTVLRVRRPRTTAFSPDVARWLRRRVRDFDVAHVHGLYLFPTLAAAHYCRRYGVPYVHQPHGGLNAYHRDHNRGRKALYELLFERRNLLGAAAIRYDSLHEQEEGIAAGFPAGVVVPPGSSVPESVDPRERQPGLVVFLGRLSEKKGLDILLEAFAEVAAGRPAVVLRIAGPDDEGIGGRIVTRARELGLADRVRLDGLVTGEAKDRLLRRAAVVVLPSADESFGAAVTEAMAYETPVVLTRGVPIYADVAAADAGLVVDRTPKAVADAVRIVLDDSARAAVLGRNARKLVASRWSWSAIARQIEQVYVDAIVRARARSSESDTALSHTRVDAVP
jgi:glycosyltransferase involved in cell wall biosynthesis